MPFNEDGEIFINFSGRRKQNTEKTPRKGTRKLEMRVLTDAPAKKGWYFHQKTKAAKKKELFLCLLSNWEYKIRIESHDWEEKNYFFFAFVISKAEKKPTRASYWFIVVDWNEKITVFDMGRNTTCRDGEKKQWERQKAM